MASRFNPYLNVDGNAARATEFYHCRLPSADCRIPVAPGPKRSPSCSTLLASVVRLGGVRAHNRHPLHRRSLRCAVTGGCHPTVCHVPAGRAHPDVC